MTDQEMKEMHDLMDVESSFDCQRSKMKIRDMRRLEELQDKYREDQEGRYCRNGQSLSQFV